MEIIKLTPTGFSSNCFIIAGEKDAFVVDPSISEERIISELQARSLNITGILLTHGHFDHIWRADQLRQKTGAPIYIHELDNEMLTDAHKNAFATFTGGNFTIGQADKLLSDADEIALENEKIKVIHTPGHTRGSVCFDTGDSLITGDTIFAEGFGRYDLYGGNLENLKKSLSQLCNLAESENRWIYPGHGDTSTLRAATENLKLYFDI